MSNGHINLFADIENVDIYIEMHLLYANSLGGPSRTKQHFNKL